MESLFSNLKAQQAVSGIEAVGTLALAVLLGAVILGLGATVLDKIKDTQTDNTATTLNNVSLTWAGNSTAISLGQDRVLASSLKLYNNGSLVNQGSNPGNYSVTSGTINITNVSSYDAGTGGLTFNDSLQWVTDKLNTSYDYKTGGAALNTTTFGLTSVNTMAEFVPTVAIVAIAGVLIGIVLLFFGRRQTSF